MDIALPFWVTLPAETNLSEQRSAGKEGRGRAKVFGFNSGMTCLAANRREPSSGVWANRHQQQRVHQERVRDCIKRLSALPRRGNCYAPERQV